MSKRKSIASSFGMLSNLPPDPKIPNDDKVEKPTDSARRIPAGVVGATQRTLTEIREERDRLLSEAEKGQHILTLDPNDIDPSPFRDRLPDDGSEAFEAFKKSLLEEGQKTPISVRRHPENEHRYQVAFGHRRWKALKELGLKIEAKLGEFSDRDLVVAQGIENSERQDLSWIEKALFSAEMESAGIKAKDIRTALSVDDAQLSKFRLVVRTIPTSIIEKIGRAPGVGRPRWLELSEMVKSKAHQTALEKTLSADKVLGLPSDQRFLVALNTLKNASSMPTGRNDKVERDLASIGKVTFGKRDIRIVIGVKHADGFKQFVETELEGLRVRYLKSIENK